MPHHIEIIKKAYHSELLEGIMCLSIIFITQSRHTVDTQCLLNEQMKEYAIFFKAIYFYLLN